jgi:hypothetical protein
MRIGAELVVSNVAFSAADDDHANESKKWDVPSQNPPSGRIEVMQPADAYRDTGQDGEHDD